MNTAAATLATAASLAVAAATAWQIHHDARRLSNAALAGLALALAATAATLFGHHGIFAVAVVLMLLSPLLTCVLVGFLLWNGWTMIRKEGRSLSNLLSLLTGLAITAAVATCLALTFTQPQAMPVMLFIVLACGWIAALFCGYLAYSWYYQHRVRTTTPDFIVVLGSGLIGDRVPPLLAGRIDRGIALWQQQMAVGHHPLLIMSGGKGPDELTSEAHAMASYAHNKGIPAQAVLIEDQSRTTAENLRNTMDVVRSHPRLGPEVHGVAVTSNYHAMRAATLAHDLDAPVDVLGAPTASYFWPSAILREFIAVLKASPTLHLVVGLCITTPLPLTFAYAINR